MSDRRESEGVSIKLSMPSAMALISPIRQFIGQIVREEGFQEEAAHDVEIALSEALTNVVEHGYPQNPVHRVDVQCEIDRDKCALTLRDEGKVFDPNTAKIPPLTEQRRERDFHLGTFYIKRCMDEIHYTSREGKNTLVMTKYRQRQTHVSRSPSRLAPNR